MKKFFMLVVLLVTVMTASAQDVFVAYLSADAPTGLSNVLNKPMGSTVMTLSDDDIYILSLTSPQDGWWKIVELWTIEEDVTSSMIGSDTGEYWIHYSNLCVGTRNYGGESLNLRDAPDEEANVVYTFNQEIVLMPMDVDGDWVKVKVDGYDIVGWIEAEWLCSNPVTNCC